MSVPCLGIISACAERSVRWASLSRTRWDHLRVCGEVGDGECVAVLDEGSSPRVRSGPGRFPQTGIGRGIISACAERSMSPQRAHESRQDHLRVCGAVRAAQVIWRPAHGSSPRVRSGRLLWLTARIHVRIISACAERSRRCATRQPNTWDHLRVCGAVTPSGCMSRKHVGSSPRVRSGPATSVNLLQVLGIISACAERSCFPT